MLSYYLQDKIQIPWPDTQSSSMQYNNQPTSPMIPFLSQTDLLPPLLTGNIPQGS